MNRRVKKRQEKLDFVKGPYSVAKFIEAGTKLFECIPDLWFINAEKTQCRWPPKSKKSATLCAIDQVLPQDDWEIYDCEFVSGGYETYSLGSNIVREKVAQLYNTSSADEHLQAAEFRRQHPGLVSKGEKCFENVFKAVTKNPTAKTNEISVPSENKNELLNSNVNEPHPPRSPIQNKSSRTLPPKNRSKNDNNRSGDIRSSHSRSSRSRSNRSCNNSSGSDIIRLSRSRSIRSRSIRNRSIRSRSIRSRSIHSRSIRSRSIRSRSIRSRSIRSRSIHSRSTRSRSIRSRSSHSRSTRTCNNSKRNRSSGSRSCSTCLSGNRSSRDSLRDSRSDGNRSSRNRSGGSRSGSNRSRGNRSGSNRSGGIRSGGIRSGGNRSGGNRSGGNRSGGNHSRDSRSDGSCSDRNRSGGSRLRDSRSYSSSNRNRSRNGRADGNGGSSRVRSNSRLVYNSFQTHANLYKNYNRSSSGKYSSSSSRDKFNKRRCYSHVQSNRIKAPYDSSGNGKQFLSKPPIVEPNRNMDFKVPSQSSLRDGRLDVGLPARRSSSICSSGSRTNGKNEKTLDNRDIENSNGNNFSASERNRIRVEKMYELHHQQRMANRCSNFRVPVSSNSLSLRTNDHSQPGQPVAGDTKALFETIVEEIREIKKIVKRNDNRFVEHDRRLTRLEVTANKSLILLGDVSNSINARVSLGNVFHREKKPPKGFHIPKLPIKRERDLMTLHKDLAYDEFYNFLVNHETPYCAPSGATDTATMTSYLRRFIDVDLKATLVLKDLKGQNGLTLYHDFNKVYLFLIDVMISAYEAQGKILTNKQAHVVLRTVWGRSKQAQNDKNKRRRRGR